MNTDKRTSLLCPNCRRLVSRTAPVCPNCGLKNPGSIWKDNFFTRGAWGEEGLLKAILAANIAKSKSPKDYAIVGEVLSVEPIACMLRKDDPKMKEALDNSIKRQIKDGSLAKLYDKWFMQPIPPNNVSLNMPLSESNKAAWANPNDKPMEDYAKK